MKVEAARQDPLSRPDVGPLEEEYVLAALRSGVLGLGPYARRFEEEFAAFCGCEHAVAVSSGTAGLHLLVRAAGIGEGDEVITSPFSFVASANVALYERATPVFADVDPDTFELDPAAVEAAITPRTRGIVPVHVFGFPCDIEAINAIADKHGLAIIEDAGEAVGARRRGRRIGGTGSPAVFAFYPNKQMTTGEGGMVTTDDAALAAQVRSLSNQGRSDTGDWLEHDRLGFNYRLDDVSAAIGLGQVERLDEILAARAAVAARYDALLGTIEGVTTRAPWSPGDERSWFVYVVRLDAAIDRDAVMAALQARGVACKPYLPAIHLQPFYRSSATGRASSRWPRPSRAPRSRCRSTRASRPTTGLRRRLPRRRPRLSVARRARRSRPSSRRRRRATRRTGGGPARHGLDGVPGGPRDLTRCRRTPARRPPRDREPRRSPRAARLRRRLLARAAV